MSELPFSRPRLLTFYAWLLVLAWSGSAIALTSIVISLIFRIDAWGILGFVLLLPAFVGFITIAPCCAVRTAEGE
jgi:hypothetical protein